MTTARWPDSVLEELDAAAHALTAWLERLDAGELRASAQTRYRIEGAVVALRALAGGDSLDALFTADDRLL